MTSLDGEIVGLLGRNGAGKTTSFRMTIGMVTPEQGQVLFHGQDVSKLAMYQRAQRGMGYLAQEPQRLSTPHGRAESHGHPRNPPAVPPRTADAAPKN